MTVRSLRQREQWNKVTARRVRAAHLKAAGKRHPLTKQEARTLCEQAAAEHPITRIPPKQTE
jgi:hypothetical protein